MSHFYNVLNDSDNLDVDEINFATKKLETDHINSYFDSEFGLRIRNYFAREISKLEGPRPLLPEDIHEYEQKLISPSIYFRPKDLRLA
jgi:hypothetical protein